jgi:hypothetical protein
MEEYRAAGELDVCQPRYSMLDRAIERDVLPYCHEKGRRDAGLLAARAGPAHRRIGMDRQLSATSTAT